MQVVRALLVALLTASAGCILAVFVGDYLTRLARVREMEGQRGMTVFFACVPLGILAGLVIGLVMSMLVRRRGAAGFIIALGWALLTVCGTAGLLGGVPYLLSDKPPQIDGKRLELQFELRAPAALKSQSSLMAKAFESVFIRTIGRAVSLSSIGLQSPRTPNTSSSPVKSLSLHTANAGLFLRRSAMRPQHRNLLS